MATFLSRRAALAAATGAGAVAALTACASDIRPLADSSASGEDSASASASESASASASASASSSAKKSYKGTVKLDKYEKNGEYVPATAEKKAQNVPKPVVPEKMNEATIEGMYQFLCYWVASFNYMFMTGDFEPLKKADPEGRYANDHANAVLIYSSGKGWVYDTDAPVTIQLLLMLPKKLRAVPTVTIGSDALSMIPMQRLTLRVMTLFLWLMDRPRARQPIFRLTIRMAPGSYSVMKKLIPPLQRRVALVPNPRS